MQLNGLIPELSVGSFEKSLHFYVDILGFVVEYSREESKFAMLSLQRSQIMLSQSNGNWETGVLQHPFGRGINFQILVAEIKPLLQALAAIAYPLMMPPMESWYRKDKQEIGQREFLVQDPDGYLLRFAESLGIRQLQPST